MHLDAIYGPCRYIHVHVATSLAQCVHSSINKCMFKVSVCVLPLCRRWLANNLSVVLSHHAFLAIAPHLYMSIPVNFCSLFTQHPNFNPPASYQFYHMILHYVQFGSCCGIGERRSIMGEKLIDIRLCGEHMDQTARQGSILYMYPCNN